MEAHRHHHFAWCDAFRAYYNSVICLLYTSEYMPFNCLHLFSLKAASIVIVAVAALLTFNGSMDLPTMLMLDMFSFMLFGSVETMNNAAHVLEAVSYTHLALSAEQQIKMGLRPFNIFEFPVSIHPCTLKALQRHCEY